MSLARRDRTSARSRSKNDPELETAVEEMEAFVPDDIADIDDLDDIADIDDLEEEEEDLEEVLEEEELLTTHEQRGSGMLFLLFGCALALLGIGLIALQQSPYAEKIDRLDAMGFPPGTFIVLGILLAALSFVIREFSHSHDSLDHLERQIGHQIRRMKRSIRESVLDPELRECWDRIDTSSRELIESNQTNSQETANNVKVLRDAEIKIDTIKRTLEETHRRVLEVHQQVAEGLSEALVSELTPQVAQAVDETLEQRLQPLCSDISKLASDTERLTREALQESGSKLERLTREAIEDSNKRVEKLTIEALAENVEKIERNNREALEENVERIERSNREALEESVERIERVHREVLEENVGRIERINREALHESEEKVEQVTRTALESTTGKLEAFERSLVESREGADASLGQLREDLGGLRAELEKQHTELDKLPKLITKNAPKGNQGGSNQADLKAIRSELASVLKSIDQLQTAMRKLPATAAAAAGPATAAVEAATPEDVPKAPSPGAAGVNNAIAKLRQMKG